MRMEQRRDECDGEFPVGMRVLAVDDDVICLTLLKTLLTNCQYHVTTTNQASRALEILREDKSQFDIVICDVHMPDMDGFKLLELVGLEMDLPVIMLSGNDDTKLVMKGITHGACDYLVKPVRIQELKNIWQHVVRKKRFDSGERNGTRSGNNENEDPATHKRPRLVWSVELHRKFVAAVNHLGFQNAGPKKILELMNVEKLTRENVASHLQKYKQYLKRISSVANQRANTVAARGNPDSPHLRMTTVNFHGFNVSPQFQNNAFRSIPPYVLGPASLGLNGIEPSSMIQPGQSQIPSQPNLLPVHQTETVSSNVIVSGLSHSLHGLPNGWLTAQEHSQERQSHDIYGINSDMSPNLLDHNTVQNTSYAPDYERIDLLHGFGNTSMGMTQGAFPCAPVLNRSTSFGPMTQPSTSSIAAENNQMFEKLKHGPLMEHGRSLGGYGGGTLEDVVTAMFTQEHNHDQEWRFPM